MKLCSPGRRARLGALGVGRVRKLRAVEGNRCHVPDDAFLCNVLSPMTADGSQGKSLREICGIAYVQ